MENERHPAAYIEIKLYFRSIDLCILIFMGYGLFNKDVFCKFEYTFYIN